MRRPLLLLAALSLVAVFGFRAYHGIVGGYAYAIANLRVYGTRFADSLPHYARAEVGFNRFEAKRRAGDARIDVWEEDAFRRGPRGADRAVLIEAVDDYAACGCLAPASRKSWFGLALVYHKLEWEDRMLRTEDPDLDPEDPWARVGRSGRLAVGFARMAVESAPEWFLFKDWLTGTYWLYGLEQMAREEIAASARVLPVYGPHEYRKSEFLHEWVTEDFVRASREMIGKIPQIDPGVHAIDLARLEARLGNHEQAIRDAQQAVDSRLDALREAEARFLLGVSLVEVGRLEEGIARLEEAGEHPVFGVSSLLNLARVAEREGDDEAALRYLRALRRADPSSAEYCVRFAELAARTGRRLKPVRRHRLPNHLDFP